ncbi:Clp protease N-terminal domain-containing protein [Actinoplanes sp. TFC3]|uniref:Clp protease N-terminal domain-containing protein n=1 Tax=Actinoplanes sp. TFC3 TaxID=1710355 RepID=UPI000834F3A9|nr:Clp protease N-terminal domain-containing protein [Actinoplanes sp. TFC3]
MFERFTHPAREAVIRAQFLARELNQRPIGTEHLLLALLEEPAFTAPALTVTFDDVRAGITRLTGPAPDDPDEDTDTADREALKAIGIDLDAVRRAIEQNFGPGALQLAREKPGSGPGPLRRLFSGGGGGHIPFSKRNKKVLELSLREALRLKHNYIAPEHLLLGILREGQGLAMQILAERKVNVERLRAELTQSLNYEAA